MFSHHSRLQDIAAGNHFTFSPISDHNEYATWAENLKTLNNPFAKPDPHPKFAPFVRTIRLPDHNSSSLPPLWNPTSPESNSKTSRAQAIFNYRQEMMDLVRGLPETTYELSLKDIVEFPATQRTEKAEEEAALTEIGEIRKGIGIQSRVIRDSGSSLLKFLMPNVPEITDGGRRSKISPRMEYGERNSSNGSSDSGCSGGGRRKWKLLGSCYSFLYRRRRSRCREF